MANKQFNEHDEYKGHYYDGLIQIAENIKPMKDPHYDHHEEEPADPGIWVTISNDPRYPLFDLSKEHLVTYKAGSSWYETVYFSGNKVKLGIPDAGAKKVVLAGVQERGWDMPSDMIKVTVNGTPVESTADTGFIITTDYDPSAAIDVKAVGFVLS